MKKYTPLTPAETMLLQVALTEYNEAMKAIEERKQNRLSSIAASHPEAKNFSIEEKDGKLVLTYDAPDEKTEEESAGPQLVQETVPPVNKPRKTRAL